MEVCLALRAPDCNHDQTAAGKKPIDGAAMPQCRMPGRLPAARPLPAVAAVNRPYDCV